MMLFDIHNIGLLAYDRENQQSSANIPANLTEQLRGLLHGFWNRHKENAKHRVAGLTKCIDRHSDRQPETLKC
jgi:hypothetical protein